MTTDERCHCGGCKEALLAGAVHSGLLFELSQLKGTGALVQ